MLSADIIHRHKFQWTGNVEDKLQLIYKENVK